MEFDTLILHVSVVAVGMEDGEGDVEGKDGDEGEVGEGPGAVASLTCTSAAGLACLHLRQYAKAMLW